VGKKGEKIEERGDEKGEEIEEQVVSAYEKLRQLDHEMENILLDKG